MEDSLDDKKKPWVWVVVGLGAVAAAVVIWQFVGGDMGSSKNPEPFVNVKENPPDTSFGSGKGGSVDDRL